METEYVRFAKNGGFFNNFGRFFQQLIQKSLKHRCLEGQSPFQSPIAEKPLEASGEAASLSYIATRCLRACLSVTYLLRNGWTDLAKLFLLAPSWSRDGFRPKNSGSGIRIFRKSGKTRFLGYYLTDLAEILRKYLPLPKYVLKQ